MTSSDARELEKRIDFLAATPQAAQLPDDARTAVRKLLDALETGRVRAAEKDAASGQWQAVPWVKRGILLGFRLGEIVDMSLGNHKIFYRVNNRGNDSLLNAQTVAQAVATTSS